MEKLRYASQYVKQNAYPFPNEDIDQVNKSKPEYFLAAMNAICSKFFMNKCSVPYDGWGERRTFSELRAYRHGKNSPNKYKDYIIGFANKQGERKTTLNISWDILQILPQKMDTVFGYLQKIKYIPNVEAIDYQALLDKKTKVALTKILTDLRMGEMIKEINSAPTINISQPSTAKSPNGIEFRSPEEVDLAEAIGIFMLEEEAAIENLLDKTQYESGSDVVNDLVKDDLATLGYAGKLVVTNPNTNIVEERYVDVDKAAFPDSAYRDYRDISWAGHYERYSIARLRKETDIDDKTAIEIARKYSTENTGNFYYNVVGDNSQFDFTMLEQIEVDVFCGYWIGKKNVNITTVTKEKVGNLIVNKVADDYDLSKVSNKKGKELHKYKNMTIYKAKMVLGSSFVFDCGEDTDINYKKDINGCKWPVFPYKFVRTGNSSLVERCISFVDDANLANLKLRVARAKMPAPPNLFIDKSAFEGVKIDGVSFKPQQLLKLLQDEGYLIGDSKNIWGNQTGGARPITPIGTDMMGVIVGWWDDMARCIDMIEKVTGINDVFAAQTPQRQTGLGVSNLLIQGSQNALTPIIKADEYAFEGAMRIAAAKWQCLSLYLTDEQKKQLSISRSLQIVNISQKIFDYQFDIKIEAGVSDNDKQQMMQEIITMRDAARAGSTSGIDEHDYLVIRAMIMSGKIKQAQLYTAHAVNKRKKEAREEQERLMRLNNEGQQQSAQQKAQNDQQTMQMESQLDTQKEAVKQQQQFKGQVALEQLKAQNELNKIILENQFNNNQQPKSA